MRLLHTSDWHVGKLIRGRSRLDEHRAALREIAGIAADESVDLIVVAGDQFETAAPSPDVESVVYEALLALAEVAPVVVIAGNHDNARRLLAVAPLFRLGRVTVATDVRPPDHGGVLELELAGTRVQVALLPFLSQRSIVRADELMANEAYQNAQEYAARLQNIIGRLCAGFTPDAVNLIVGHAFVQGGATGGGERAAHLVEEYGVSAVAFPPTASYVALGHLHRAQVVRGATAIHYCGSPLQLDFGEEAQTKQVNIVDVAPGLPAKVKAVPLASGRALRTVKGTLDQLAVLADTVGDAWLRVRVDEPARAGLADEVRALLGDGVVDVTVDHQAAPAPRAARRRDGRAPRELFADFLADRELQDPRLITGFDDLMESAIGGAGDDE